MPKKAVATFITLVAIAMARVDLIAIAASCRCPVAPPRARTPTVALINEEFGPTPWPYQSFTDMSADPGSKRTDHLADRASRKRPAARSEGRSGESQVPSHRGEAKAASAAWRAQLDDRMNHFESLLIKLTEAVVDLGSAQQAPTVIERIEPDFIAEEALRNEIDLLKKAIETLTIQNEQLAGEIAQGSVRQSIKKSSDSSATLTWEERKALMFAEEDRGEVDQETLACDLAAQSEMIQRLREDLRDREEQISQLRDLLEHRPAECDTDTAIGAAAIARMMDTDELIQEERQRLQSLQNEWEAKFREMEIAASIERANLARERQQLERQNAELEEQLTHLKREIRQEELTGPNQTRRWLAKLGLAD